MKGERTILGSFPDNIDLNQGSSSHTAAVDRSAAWDNLLNPIENQLSNYALSSGEGNTFSMDHASHDGRTLGGWDRGDSSSGANVQSLLNANDLKTGPSWSSSLNTCMMTDGRPTDWQFEQPDLFLRESNTTAYIGNYPQRPLSIHNSISTHSPFNASISGGYRSDNGDHWQSRGSGTSSNLYQQRGRSHMDGFPAFGSASENVGTYSGSPSYLVQPHDGSGSSSSTWGLSCKRKAIEGNPARPCSSGNRNTDQAEIVGRHAFTSRYNASNSLNNISASSMNFQTPSYPGQLIPRIGTDMRGGNYGFRPLSVKEVAEGSERNFGFRADHGQCEPVPFDLSASRHDIRHPSTHSTHHPSRLISTAETTEVRDPFPRSLHLNSNPNQSQMMQVLGSARSLLPFPQNGSVSASSGASSSSTLFSGERGTAIRDEATFRSSQVNHPEHSNIVSLPETMHMVQEPAGWSFSRGNTSSSRNVALTSRIPSSSGSHPFPTVWMPHQNPTAHNQQRLAEFTPWTLFPPVEPEPGGHRGQFSFFPSASSSSEEAVMSSGSSSGEHILSYSGSLLMEVSSDDVNGWRALAAGTEGRLRIASEIRQVLNAMRRAENWRAEDYMHFDPFIIGAAELHDRHRDMRLDVDNMSYEELLALEERIGNVSTGLSEDSIMQSMRQRKHHRFFTKESSNHEPCCVCQEDYIVGDDIGILDCGHEFHTNCIKQWLTLKNLCPICKMTALETRK